MQTLTLHFYSVPGAPAHNSRQHAAGCQDLLDNNVYHCQIKSDVPETFEGCFRFTPPRSTVRGLRSHHRWPRRHLVVRLPREGEVQCAPI